MFDANSPDFNRKAFLDYCTVKQKELGKRQREYKKILLAKTKTQKDAILEASYINANSQLRKENNDLRAQIWTASGVTHARDNARMIDYIQCHITCYEFLSEEVKDLKVDVSNLEKEIGRAKKQICELNKKTVPDEQFQAHVARTRRRMSILENKLETNVRREGALTAQNAKIREDLVKVLNYKTYFNEKYTKLIERLNSDKKYLIDLIDYAINTQDHCIDFYEKIDNLVKKETREGEARRIEMQNLMRREAAESFNIEFMSGKGKKRVLADLQPKEYRRRSDFRVKHHDEINLYKDILSKILKYTHSPNVDMLIDKYQKQESLYYSYFSYTNEVSYHMTLLNNSVNRLYNNITRLKTENNNKFMEQLDTIKSLEDELRDKKNSLAELYNQRDENNALLNSSVKNIDVLFKMCNANPSPLSQYLGDHNQVNLVNVRRFLKILENQIFDVVATAYLTQRAENVKKRDRNFVVKDIGLYIEPPSDINKIVLAQQCAECGEGEAHNDDDVAVDVQTKEEAYRKLYEKVMQPDLQYRLHSISQCRLPRSRILAAKRNM